MTKKTHKKQLTFNFEMIIKKKIYIYKYKMLIKNYEFYLNYMQIKFARPSLINF